MTVPTFTPPPEAPSRQSPGTFASRADAFVGYLAAFANDLIAAIPWLNSVFAKASTIKDITQWQSDVSYQVGNIVWSPADRQIYRALKAVTSASDPSMDLENWTLVGGILGLAEGTPTGTIIWFSSQTPPDGYLICDGSALSRAAYPELFGVIETTHGAGNGDTTFNLPDLRGEFIRGWDNGRDVDIGRSFGSWQDNEIQSHAHRVDELCTPSFGQGSSGGETGLSRYSGVTWPMGGGETRPRNVALLACIKY